MTSKVISTDASDRPSLSVRCLRALREGIGGFDERSGIGLDEYCQDPIPHAMAEGHFLSALAACTDRFSAASIRKFAEASVGRLEELSLPQSAGGVAWGLGFPYKDILSTEPYVITTCFVLDGLAAIQESVHDARVPRLIEAARSWLRDLPDDMRLGVPGGPQLPAYSPATRSSPWNMVVNWTSHLEPTDPRRAEVRRYVIDHRIPGVGWSYEGRTGRIDLLHQGYTITGLEPEQDVLEEWVLDALGLFSGPEGWLDKIDFLAAADAARYRGRPGFLLVPASEGHAFVVHPNPARDWSIGEALRLSSIKSEDEERRTALRRMASSLAEEALLRLEAADEAYHPRPVAHLLLGLAAFLKSRT